jgi:hypothetical protein
MLKNVNKKTFNLFKKAFFLIFGVQFSLIVSIEIGVIFQVYSLLFNLRKLLRLKILLFKKVNVILVMKSILKEELIET